MRKKELLKELEGILTKLKNQVPKKDEIKNKVEKAFEEDAQIKLTKEGGRVIIDAKGNKVGLTYLFHEAIRQNKVLEEAVKMAIRIADENEK